MIYNSVLPKHFVNTVEETIVAFGSVAAAATSIKNLGTLDVYDHIAVRSSLNQPVVITFATGKILTVDASDSFAYDGLFHNGVISLHYSGAAPGSGNFRMRSW